MSIRARILNHWLRAVERRALGRFPVSEPELVRARFDTQMRRINGRPRKARAGMVAGFKTLEVGPTGGVPVLYFHGGGYFFGSPAAYYGLAARLSRRCGLRVILPTYPLAPENPFPAAPDAALRIYRALAAQGPVILAGDSAGGGLALSLLAQISGAGLPQPSMTFVLSPLTDLTLSGESHKTNAASEAVLPPERMADGSDGYLNGAAADDPRASPLFADFTGASPVRIWVGDKEILYDDSRRMAVRLREQGVDVTLVEEQNLPHVWPLFPNWLLPESGVTLDQIAAEIQTSLDSANR